MARLTIDYGIDLGTTNSAVALLTGVEPQVIPNTTKQASVTPSAVWIDKRGRIRVGEEAKERFEADPSNCDIEFKARMGLGEAGAKPFADAGRKLLPEELSAEVLKSLKADVQTARGEELRASVITVPAAFELRQCDATRKAAQLAGLALSPLLQEPVAAALAYGFQNEGEKAFWLVYDFGGGTFDAAIMQVRDGVIQVVNHAGDNHLGGKLIDWEIVESRFIPALLNRHSLPDFRRGNARWMSALAKLKTAAEKAKIDVCRKRVPAEVWIENLVQDASGQSIDFEYQLTPDDVQALIQPYVSRSINLCQKALREKGLDGANMGKILMVGGTSLIPWLREQVEAELRAPLDFSIDPMTVVARGAAVFAGTQRLPADSAAPLPAGTFAIDLEYSPQGNEVDPEIGGRVKHPQGQSTKGFAVEIVETKTQWRSGKIRLGDDGHFDTAVLAERGRKCEFAIELYDPTGAKRAVAPDRFHYTVGVEFDGSTLINSVGVAMANNQVDRIFKKGAPLPVRARTDHRTVLPFQRGSTGTPIKIPIIEGENVGRADRNRLVFTLEIPAADIRRDLPPGSEVEITVRIDESRMMTITAFFPVLDQEFTVTKQVASTIVAVPELQRMLEAERSRLASARAKADRSYDAKAAQALDRIEREAMIAQIERALAAAQGDAAAVQECEKRLLDLKEAVDQVEDALEWPALVAEAERHLRDTRELVDQYGDESDRKRLVLLERDLHRAMDGRDPDRLRQQDEEVQSLGNRVLARQPGYWIELLEYLESRQDAMRDPSLAHQLFAQGRRAINANDVDGLRAVVRQLFGLLPPGEQEMPTGYGGSTTK